MTTNGSESVNAATRRLLNMTAGGANPRENPFTTAGTLGIVPKVILEETVEIAPTPPDLLPGIPEEDVRTRNSIFSRVAEGVGRITGLSLFRPTNRGDVRMSDS